MSDAGSASGAGGGAASLEEKYWKASYQAKAREFNDLQETYIEFQESTQEFETELEAELQHAQEEGERTRVRLTKVESQLRRAREELARQQSDAAEQLAQQGGGDQRLTILMRQKHEVERRLNEQLDDARAQAAEAEERAEQLAAELEEQADEVAGLERDLRAAQQQAQQQQQKQQQQGGDDGGGGSGGGGGADAAALEQVVADLREEIEELSATVEGLHDEKVQLEMRLLEESELNEELTQEVSDLTDDFMAGQDRIEELEAAAEAAADAASARAEASASAAAAAAASGAAAAASTDLEAERAAARELRASLEAERERGEDLAAEVRQLSAAANAARRDADEAAERAQAAEERAALVSEAEARAAALEEEIFDTNSSLTDAVARAEEADKRAADAEAALREAASSGAHNATALSKGMEEMRERVEELERREAHLLEQAELAERERAEADRARAAEAEALLSVRARRRADSDAASARAREAMSSSGGAPGRAAAVCMADLRSAAADAGDEMARAAAEMAADFGRLGQAVGTMGRVMASSERNLREAAAEKRALFDDLQGMKGNIRVFCRLRPLLGDELKRAQEFTPVHLPGNDQVSVVPSAGAGESESKTFQFDRVFGPDSTQAEVYRGVRPLVESVLDGYNVCIFAYGQTGSGKTHTMEGPAHDRGVNFRAASSLFGRIASLAPQYAFRVHVSLLEIYNEKLGDLLDADSVRGLERDDNVDDGGGGRRGGGVQIRQVSGGGTAVSGAVRLRVSSADEVMRVLAEGAKNRAVGTTSANEHSSRSHSILIIDVEGVDQISRATSRGKLHLVDLAGSERQAHSQSTGQRLKEATFINKSLSALGDVMTALSSGGGGGGSKKGSAPAHVPYRNSKLTYLLQDSLGGNSKTMMFVNASPADRSAQETLCSLQFARRVRKVKLSPTASVQNAALQQYREKLDAAKADAKQNKAQMERIKAKLNARLREKEELVYELKEQIKGAVARANQAEIQKRKELSEVQAESKKLGRQTSQRDLNARVQSLQQKYDQVNKLLKLSQRENQSLKKAKAEAESRGAAAASRDSVARRRAGTSADGGFGEGKDARLVRLLREKNRKLSHELSELKLAKKRSRVVGMMSDRDHGLHGSPSEDPEVAKGGGPASPRRRGRARSREPSGDLDESRLERQRDLIDEEANAASSRRRAKKKGGSASRRSGGGGGGGARPSVAGSAPVSRESSLVTQRHRAHSRLASRGRRVAPRTTADIKERAGLGGGSPSKSGGRWK